MYMNFQRYKKNQILLNMAIYCNMYGIAIYRDIIASWPKYRDVSCIVRFLPIPIPSQIIVFLLFCWFLFCFADYYFLQIFFFCWSEKSVIRGSKSVTRSDPWLLWSGTALMGSDVRHMRARVIPTGSEQRPHPTRKCLPRRFGRRAFSSDREPREATPSELNQASCRAERCDGRLSQLGAVRVASW